MCSRAFHKKTKHRRKKNESLTHGTSIKTTAVYFSSVLDSRVYSRFGMDELLESSEAAGGINFIPCVKFVRRGVAKGKPERVRPRVKSGFSEGVKPMIISLLR